MKLLNMLILWLALFQVSTLHAQDNSTDEKLLVIVESRVVPKGFKHLGDIMIRGNMASKCGYNRAMNLAKEAALKKGGNILKITSVMPPDASSQCYRVKADVYSTDKLDEYKAYYKSITDSIMKHILPDTALYALLYIYRPKIYTGMTIAQPFKLFTGNEEICNIANGANCIVKLTQIGSTTIYAKVEKRDEVVLDVKHGNVYFIRVDVTPGMMSARPDLEEAPADMGLDGFNNCVGAEKN